MPHHPDHIDGVVSSWGELTGHETTPSYALALRIARAGRIMNEKLQEVAAAFGLTVRGDYELLSSLRRSSGPLQPSQIAAILRVTTAGITGRLNRLERQGHIRRLAHPTDRRAVQIGLTPSGKDIADTVYAACLESLEDMLAPLPATVRGRMNDDLRRLLVLMDIDGTHG